MSEKPPISHPSQPSRRATRRSVNTARRTTTNALMQGSKRIVIEHNEEDYILQITRSGRLILTK
jgi:hemin uptake protein HemP